MTLSLWPSQTALDQDSRRQAGRSLTTVQKPLPAAVVFSFVLHKTSYVCSAPTARPNLTEKVFSSVDIIYLLSFSITSSFNIFDLVVVSSFNEFKSHNSQVIKKYLRYNCIVTAK